MRLGLRGRLSRCRNHGRRTCVVFSLKLRGDRFGWLALDPWSLGPGLGLDYDLVVRFQFVILLPTVLLLCALEVGVLRKQIIRIFNRSETTFMNSSPTRTHRWHDFVAGTELCTGQFVFPEGGQTSIEDASAIFALGIKASGCPLIDGSAESQPVVGEALSRLSPQMVHSPG